MVWIQLKAFTSPSPRDDSQELHFAAADGSPWTVVQERLLKSITGDAELLNSGELDEAVFRPYFAYFSRQWQEALSQRWQDTSLRSHHDLIEIIPLIRDTNADGIATSKDAILKACKDKSEALGEAKDDDFEIRTIELAARTLVMHRISEWGATSRSFLCWNPSESLQESISRQHSGPQMDEKVKLEKTFDILALVKVAGVSVIWTENLIEHLSLHDDGQRRTLRIFHHAAYLNTMMMTKANRQVFPEKFIEETVSTLKLLFPRGNKAVRQWLKAEAAEQEPTYPLDLTLLKCGTLLNEARQIDQFHFWRDRLTILKQAFDESQPRTLTQWWNDRRNQVQWATFWTAVWVLVLTVFFGLAQSIEGAIQVYKAYHPSGG